MTVTSTPVWHDIFRRVTLKPDNITLEAETYEDTLNIVRGPGVNFGSANTSTDTFEINVDYDISVPAATTKISLEDVNGNLSEITLTPGRGVAINRISAQELEFESFSVTETDTLHTVTERNNITSNKIFVNDIEVGTIVSNTSEDGFTGYDAGHNLIGNGTLDNPMRFSPLYQDSIAANNTDQFEFVAVGPGTLAYAANYVFDTAATTGSVTLEREDPSNPGNWTTLDTQSGNSTGTAYFIDGTYSELYSGSVTYRLTFDWTGNTGTATWYTNDTFEGGAYTPIANPQIKTDTTAKTVDINDLQFFQNTIRTLTSNTDVVFDLSGTGQVRVLGDVTADNFYGNLTGNVTGDVSGNAGTVTNGVYTTGSYADPSWITSLDGFKIINGVLTTGVYYDPSWIASLDASKIVGSIALSDITIDGTIRIFDNVIETTTSNADLELRPSGTGQVKVIGDITANMFYSDVTGNVVGNLTGDVTGNVVGNLTGDVISSEIIVDGTILIYDNVIETIVSNADLELRANGTGRVLVSDTLVATQIVGPIGTSTQNSGAFTTLSASGTVDLNPAGFTVSLAPTGVGTVTINPATAGTINNMSIGATTRAAGNFTSLDANGNVTLGSDDTDSISINANFSTGTQIKSAKSNGNTLNIAAYDVDGATYTNLITLTAGNTPTLSLISIGALSISSAATGSMDNVIIGGTTRAAGSFTRLNVSAGTTSVAPITLASGTNLSVVTAGAFEYDGTILNFTPSTDYGRAAIPTAVYTSGAGTALTPTATGETVAQTIFPTANDTITLPIGTYRIEMTVLITRGTGSTTSATARINLGGGGGAVGTFSGQATSSVIAAGGASSLFAFNGVALTVDNVVSAANAVNGGSYNIYLTGILRITTAGTFIPKYSLSANLTSATTPTTTGALSYMVINSLATSGTVASTGGWA